MVIKALPLIYRKRKRARRARRGHTPVAAAPVLVGATFDTSDGAILTLTFDRDVAIGTFVTSSMLVVNEPGESRYDAGAGASVIAPSVVRVEMTVIDVVPAGADVLLSATGASGIVAAEGGTAWAGVDELELPYP